MRPARSTHAFSFVELLIAMAVVAVLASMFMGGSAYLQRKKLARCAENLRTLHLALTLYARENGDAFPIAVDATNSDVPLNLLVPRYTSDSSVIACPASSHKYSYVSGLRRDATSVLAADELAGKGPFPAGSELFAKRGAHADLGGNVLFADGHVEQLSQSAPRAILPSGTVLNPRP